MFITGPTYTDSPGEGSPASAGQEPPLQVLLLYCAPDLDQPPPGLNGEVSFNGPFDPWPLLKATERRAFGANCGGSFVPRMLDSDSTLFPTEDNCSYLGLVKYEVLLAPFHSVLGTTKWFKDNAV